MNIKMGYADVEVRSISSREAEGEGAWGTYSACEGIIRIRGDLSPREQARVLLHEIIHAVMDLWRRHDNDTLDEETVCRTLDRGLSAVIRDNPALFPYLQRALVDGEEMPL